MGQYESAHKLFLKMKQEIGEDELEFYVDPVIVRKLSDKFDGDK